MLLAHSRLLLRYWLGPLTLCLICLSSQADEGRSTLIAAINDKQNLEFEVNSTTTATRRDNFPSYAQPNLLLAQTAEALKKAGISGPEAITVIFPDIGEPFRSIFTKIIEGIEEQVKSKVRSIPIPNNMDPAELNVLLRRNGTKVVIALGQRGFKMANGLGREYSVVIGGVLSIPETDQHQFTIISLTPDPALLFNQLRGLIPGIRRVIVVYNPSNNEWLIKLARVAAKAQGLELIAYEARDLATAARRYESAFATADNRFDSLWLPQDSTTVEESTILPLVLKESWNRSVPIFSSNFIHVKKGALFALYPNNSEMGRNLAVSAMSNLAGDMQKRGVSPLKDVLIAVNVRTAQRIGLNIGEQKQRSFDFIFPEP